MITKTTPVLLVAEDNSDDEGMTLRALRRHPLRPNVIVVRDGQEALDLLRSLNGDLPDLALVDFHMPRMSGLELTEAIRGDRRLRKLPVVIFSNSDNPSEKFACLAAGANAVITKPIDYEKYNEAVARIARDWLVVRTEASA